MIETTAALEDACRALAQSDFITIDTEFLRETTFWPQLCLIQMASPTVEVLVDPLAKGLDLSPFFALMADPKVIKVFHAARQDIEIIHHLGGLVPHPIFDTQVAAMVCGFGDSVSYDQLVQRISGAQIDKSSRFTDWSRRPLSDKQLEYAMADVTHLRDVYLSLKEQLEREGRASWLTEEMAILESPGTYDIHPDDAWLRLKSRLRKPQELAILKFVAAWREREARSRNVPRSRVLKDDAIYEIAQQQPKDTEALSRLRTVPKGWERSSSGTGVIEAVNAALALPKAEMPHAPKSSRSPEGTGAAVELLKVLLKLISDREGVAAKVIANTDDLEKIAAEGEMAEVAALHGWRRELFGDTALQLISGGVALRFVDRKVEAVTLTGDAD
ncbi:MULTISPECIES: ribonuclease D [Pseudorhizobium]|uniref:Ribonuclease D n=1 Tax=Pseudorhizobium pelagicum TaxID=1509405 RepID=A0A922NZ48_9HYPH|nr:MULTISPECIES: ribonuclease D [Pseudorhizobium]MBU1317370.1 ribonuclease D [Alphaproteobacteria bacterium]KEQ04626.1 ribonuclease D [Pseudorhizobium pelagicum]KEQ07011.1 ribonuclease D [Pseudorhizobium pelagicum]MBU1551802.1 ribonuclease D [Alphaproteobacteria bacterium]MBU2335230.1 ribonuclease D [Alphaproteobacteria bacterium]|tara:strand:+ start:1947 stop:3107 length:1161 start_codon:yes stop_codon:yes gene_type:complete